MSSRLSPSGNTSMSSTERPSNGNRFISIGAIDVTLRDFQRLWDGEEAFLPDLSDHDLEIIRRLEHLPRPHELTAIPNEDIYANLLGKAIGAFGMTTKLFQKRKYRQLKALIDRHKIAAHDKSSFNLHRIMAALTNDNIRFSTVAELLARCEEPSAESAERVEGVIDEVDATDQRRTLRTRYVNRDSARPISQALATIKDTRERTGQAFALAPIPHKGLPDLPVILLEKAAFGHDMSEDDLRELSRLRNIGRADMVQLIRYMRYVLMMGGMGIVGTAFHFPQLEIPMELARQLMNVGFGTMSLGFGLHLYPSRAREKTERMQSSMGRYKKILKQLTKRIDELKKTAYGKIQVLLLQRMILSTYGEAEPADIEMLQRILSSLEDPVKRRQFEEYARSADPNDFESVAGIKRLIEPLAQAVEEIDSKLGPVPDDFL